MQVWQIVPVFRCYIFPVRYRHNDPLLFCINKCQGLWKVRYMAWIFFGMKIRLICEFEFTFLFWNLFFNLIVSKTRPENKDTCFVLWNKTQEKYYETVKEWYDGYRFGNVDVYCPWDVINFCSDHLADPGLEPKNYWANTSGNSVISHFIDSVGKPQKLTRMELEQLVNGGIVQKEM